MIRGGVAAAVLVVLLAVAAARAAPDAALATAVHERLAADRKVDAQQVRVEAEGGVVQLLGEVDSEAERKAAGAAAAKVPGVRRVDNRLTVKASVAPAPGTSPIPERPAP
jgi:osmotically-inducible protein OsmY